MPRQVKELSDLEVRRLVTPGLHSVGGVTGLYLQVTPKGARMWTLRAMVGSKRRDIGLGGFPSVTLSAARAAARTARAAIRDGVDPAEQRQQARAALRARQAKRLTFEKAAEKYIEAQRHGWRSAKHADQWTGSLKTYAYPVMGDTDVSEVTRELILQAIGEIWRTKSETASRVRGRIERVLDWAKAAGHRTGDNPAAWKGNLDTALSKGRIKRVEHHPAIPTARMHAFMQDLRQRQGVAALALEFLALTAARSGEVLGMPWSEIDMATGVWTVPAERMKAGKEHQVPLSIQALALLEKMPRIEGSDLVFPGQKRGKPLSDMAMTGVMRRMEVEAVPHGLRSSFRDWAGELTNFPRELAEEALAHAVGNAVERSYRRGTALEKRRRMMQAWADYCDQPAATGGQVVPLRAAA